MAEKRKLEFFLLRYVPDAVKGEFVNFGLVTIGDGTNGAELIEAFRVSPRRPFPGWVEQA